MIIKDIIRHAWLLALALPGALQPAPAAGLFLDETVLDTRLTGPLSAAIDAGAERTEYPFMIVVDGVATPVEVRTRGKSRLRVCDFPPLRLDFAAESAAGSVFDGQDKLKLVTHCKEKRGDAGNVLDEYLAYRLFSLVSESSYGVRRLRLWYVDGEETSGPFDAFLIESDEALAERLDADVVEAPGVYLSRLDPEQAARVYVFQYLIGNTDWSLVKADLSDECCHNVDLFERDGQLLVVPYDFDLAGLVDASYAKPDPDLRIRSVRSRRYRGYCLSRDALERALDHIIALEQPILAMAGSVSAGDANAGAKRVEYLDEFFEEARDRDKLLKEFEKRCLE